jgi:hypothetical protein
MKSFKEWKSSEFGAKNILEVNLFSAMRNWMGGSNVKIDNTIKTKLRTRILQLWADAQEQGMSALDFARQIMATVVNISMGKSGTNFNVKKAVDSLSQQPQTQQSPQTPQQQEWNKLCDLVSEELMLEMGEDEIDNIDLLRILGSSSIRVNRNLEIRLKPKLQQIFKDKDFSEEDPSELLRQVIVVAAKEITGASGTTLSTQKLAKGLSNDDPIAREMP